MQSPSEGNTTPSDCCGRSDGNLAIAGLFLSYLSARVLVLAVPTAQKIQIFPVD